MSEAHRSAKLLADLSEAGRSAKLLADLLELVTRSIMDIMALVLSVLSYAIMPVSNVATNQHLCPS